MDYDQIERDVALLAEVKREGRDSWRPRLEEASDAAKRLEEAGYVGADMAWVKIGEGALQGLDEALEEIAGLLEGEGDELWYMALSHAARMDQAPTLHATLLKVGRERFHAALRTMPLGVQARALTWLGDEETDYMWDQPCPEAAQLYSAATGLTVEPGEPRRRPTPEQSAEFRRAAAALLASVKG